MYKDQNNEINQFNATKHINFLFERNLCTENTQNILDYSTIDQHNQSQGLQQTFNRVCSKNAGVYDNIGEQTKKANMRPYQFMWMGNGNHCIASYFSNQNRNQDIDYKFDLHLINTNTYTKEKYYPQIQNVIKGIGGLCQLNDGKTVILGDKEGNIHWLDYTQTNYHNNGIIAEVKRQKIGIDNFSLNQICASPDGKKLTIGDTDKNIHFLDTETGKLENEEKEAPSHGQRISYMQWHPFKAMLMSTGDDKYINIWCPKQKERLLQMNHNAGVNKAIWHKNGNWILSCGKDKVIKLYDIRNCQKEEVQKFICNEKDIRAIDWHPLYENIFASGDKEGFRQWDINQNINLDFNKSVKVTDLKYNVNGDILGVFGEDKTVKFFKQGKQDYEKQNLPENNNNLNMNIGNMGFQNNLR